MCLAKCTLIKQFAYFCNICNLYFICNLQGCDILLLINQMPKSFDKSLSKAQYSIKLFNIFQNSCICNYFIFASHFV